MSNMQYKSVTYAGDVQILKRPPFEGVPITLDFSEVTAKDTATGLKVVKAGTPIGSNGKAANTSSAIGILLFDVLEDRPQGTILKKAYLNTAVAESHSGISYDDAVKAALPMVVFE
ncbi:MAG: hypothetical protein J6S67_19285 [Methanobrevibacter sp.]|nr:hypothetical protein [Methanobrevibacter sp.]